MDHGKINTHKVFGKPSLAMSESQLYYTAHEHAEDAIYKRDRKWFVAHPRQQRFIRPAFGNEFDVADEHLDHFGVRVAPPKLWVSVERRLGRQHVVQPVYRGSCFWDVDANGYMLPNDANDDEGNTTADTVLYQIHMYGGKHPVQMFEHAGKVVEVLTALSIPDGGRSN
jgi:hypothetical protein